MRKFHVGRKQQEHAKGYENEQVYLPPYEPPTYYKLGKPYPFRDIKAINTKYLHYQQPYVTNQKPPAVYNVANNMPYNKVYGNPDDIEKFMLGEEAKMTSKKKFQSYIPEAENLRFFSTQVPTGLPQTIEEQVKAVKTQQEKERTKNENRNRLQDARDVLRGAFLAPRQRPPQTAGSGASSQSPQFAIPTPKSSLIQKPSGGYQIPQPRPRGRPLGSKNKPKPSGP